MTASTATWKPWNLPFGSEIDYAQLVKLYGNDSPGRGSAPAEIRYSPPPCTGARKTRLIGSPDKSLVSTSYVERQNLTLRMSNRRFTRLTNGYSKKIENHAHMLAIHFMVYNFCRIHHTLRVTPRDGSGYRRPSLELGRSSPPDRLTRMASKFCFFYFENVGDEQSLTEDLRARLKGQPFRDRSFTFSTELHLASVMANLWSAAGEKGHIFLLDVDNPRLAAWFPPLQQTEFEQHNANLQKTVADFLSNPPSRE